MCRNVVAAINLTGRGAQKLPGQFYRGSLLRYQPGIRRNFDKWFPVDYMNWLKLIRNADLCNANLCCANLHGAIFADGFTGHSKTIVRQLQNVGSEDGTLMIVNCKEFCEDCIDAIKHMRKTCECMYCGDSFCLNESDMLSHVIGCAYNPRNMTCDTCQYMRLDDHRGAE